jgi:ADP-ribose pyrophosphatase
MNKEFIITKKEIAYSGFFRLEKYWLKHTLYGGGWSEELCRELLVRGGCVAVLLYDPNADKVVLIEQFRAGAILNPEQAWLIEIVAGAIEEGETAVEVAYREAMEEAGCDIQALIKINEFYTTPGGMAERITLFCGKVDSTKITDGVHGLDEELEDIWVRTVSFEQAYQMVESNEIDSAIPILAIQWLALHREQLRKQWLSP